MFHVEQLRGVCNIIKILCLILISLHNKIISNIFYLRLPKMFHVEHFYTNYSYTIFAQNICCNIINLAYSTKLIPILFPLFQIYLKSHLNVLFYALSYMMFAS